MARILSIFFGLCICLKVSTSSTCSGKAASEDLPRLKMCHKTERETNEVVLDTHGITSSRGDKCSCTISNLSPGTSIRVKNLKGLLPLEHYCKQQIRVENLESKVIYEYQCMSNSTVSFKVDNGSDIKFVLMNKLEVNSSAVGLCLKISVAENNNAKFICSGDAEIDEKWYIYILPITLISLVFVILCVLGAVFFFKRRRLGSQKNDSLNGYTTTDSPQTEEDLESLATEDEMGGDSKEPDEIMPDDVTVSLFHQHKARDHFANQEGVLNEKEVAQNSDNFPGRNITEIETFEIKSENGIVYHVIAPSGDEYAIVTRNLSSNTSNTEGNAGKLDNNKHLHQDWIFKAFKVNGPVCPIQNGNVQRKLTEPRRLEEALCSKTTVSGPGYMHVDSYADLVFSCSKQQGKVASIVTSTCLPKLSFEHTLIGTSQELGREEEDFIKIDYDNLYKKKGVFSVFGKDECEQSENTNIKH